MLSSKPKILKDKIKLAELIRENWIVVNYQKGPTSRSYWRGVFKKPEGREIDIYFQFYVRDLNKGVDYVRLTWVHNRKALSVKEIKELVKLF